MTPTQHAIAIEAGDKFRETLVGRADSIDSSGAPLWNGWALMESYLAGVEQGRREMQAECLRIAEVWLDNKIGAEIAADIRALKA